MNHQLTADQKQQMHTELSRRYHLMLANLDEQVQQLRASNLPIETYIERYNAIEALRQQLRQQYERETHNVD